MIEWFIKFGIYTNWSKHNFVLSKSNPPCISNCSSNFRPLHLQLSERSLQIIGLDFKNIYSLKLNVFVHKIKMDLSTIKTQQHQMIKPLAWEKGGPNTLLKLRHEISHPQCKIFLFFLNIMCKLNDCIFGNQICKSELGRCQVHHVRIHSLSTYHPRVYKRLIFLKFRLFFDWQEWLRYRVWFQSPQMISLFANN